MTGRHCLYYVVLYLLYYLDCGGMYGITASYALTVDAAGILLF